MSENSIHHFAFKIAICGHSILWQRPISQILLGLKLSTPHQFTYSFNMFGMRGLKLHNMYQNAHFSFFSKHSWFWAKTHSRFPTESPPGSFPQGSSWDKTSVSGNRKRTHTRCRCPLDLWNSYRPTGALVEIFWRSSVNGQRNHLIFKSRTYEILWIPFALQPESFGPHFRFFSLDNEDERNTQLCRLDTFSRVFSNIPRNIEATLW